MPMSKQAATLSQLFFGFTDGKHEFDEVSEETFERSYYVPENLSVASLISGEKFVVSGPRGSGKTTLLRWIAHSMRHDRVTAFLLFKSDVSEEEKRNFSRASGIKEITFDGIERGIIQEFRDLWKILIISKICGVILENTHTVADVGPVNAILRLAGSGMAGFTLENVVPNSLKLVRLRWKDIASGLEWELGLWGSQPDAEEKVTTAVLSRTMLSIFSSIEFRVPLTLLIDELEVFFKSDEQFTRDSDLIRDSVLVCGELRSFFNKKKIPVSLIIALRDEVISAIGARGEEIYKVVDDYSVAMNWTESKSIDNHPLIRMLQKKRCRQLLIQVYTSFQKTFSLA